MEGVRAWWSRCWESFILLLVAPLAWLASGMLRLYAYLKPDWALADHLPGPASGPLPSRPEAPESPRQAGSLRAAS